MIRFIRFTPRGFESAELSIFMLAILCRLYGLLFPNKCDIFQFGGRAGLKLTQQNVNRLASISAFGAGILTFAVPAAEAGIIVVNPNTTVGFGGGSLSSYSVNLPGSHDLRLERTSSTSSNSYRVRFRGSSSNFVTSGADRLKPFAAGGAKWSVAGGGLSEFGFAASDFSGNEVTQMTSTNRYFLFRFADSTAGDSFRYGWGEVSVSFAGH